jgi:surfeit locus 1 family protein
MSPRARIVFLLVCLLVAAACLRLGLWQRSRLHERRVRNALVAARRALPPVALPGAAGPVADRRVVAAGEYDVRHDMLLRHQVVREVPGVLVVTPLRLAGSDSAVLVVRGFVPSPDGLAAPGLDTLVERGPQTVEGVALPIEQAADSGKPVDHAGRTSWQRLDGAALRTRLPYPVLDVAIAQAPSPALRALPRRQELRPLDDGPHRSYMLQWFGFAATAVITGLVVLLGRRAPRWSEPTAPVPAAGGPPPPPRGGTPAGD